MGRGAYIWEIEGIVIKYYPGEKLQEAIYIELSRKTS